MVLLYAATRGYLDKLTIADVGKFEQAVMKNVDRGLLKRIRIEKELKKDLEAEVKTFLDGVLSTIVKA